MCMLSHEIYYKHWLCLAFICIWYTLCRKSFKNKNLAGAGGLLKFPCKNGTSKEWKYKLSPKYTFRSPFLPEEVPISHKIVFPFWNIVHFQMSPQITCLRECTVTLLGCICWIFLYCESSNVSSSSLIKGRNGAARAAKNTTFIHDIWTLDEHLFCPDCWGE